MSWIAISEACKTRIQPLIKSSDLQDSDENPEEVMTRNLYAGFRNKGLQDSVSYSDEIMPTIWNYIFFSSPCLSITSPSQTLTLLSPLSAPPCVFSSLMTLGFLAFFPLSLCICWLCFCSHSWAGYLQGLSRDIKHSITILPLALDIRAAASL